jgi:phytoene dehydrogenase-like protein
VVVGSGPNGLAAAITLAQAGHSVLVVEAAETIGGGMRSAELTHPGFVHDICSAIHPLGAGSPFFRQVPLARYGLHWIHPPAPLAHPLDGSNAAILERSIRTTGATLGSDARAYWQCMAPLVRTWGRVSETILAPLRVPRYPFAVARFGLYALHSACHLAQRLFKGDRAQALFAGLAAHSFLPLEHIPGAAFGLTLGMAGHAIGWPMPRGGAQHIASALAAYLRSLGGSVVTGWNVASLDDLPPSRLVLWDVTPRQLVNIAGTSLPAGYRHRLERYRYGPGVFKVDLALGGPIPWQAAACHRAGTLHLGGTLHEIAAAERAVLRGEHPDRPFVLVAQQSLFDDTRAPPGKHTAWAYCHVPHSSTVDMSEQIEAQIERFAPGFRARILARSVMGPVAMEHYNANYIGGDINGGIQDMRQLFTRPVVRLNPYKIPVRGWYLCSSSTPPGGGVHGMCGYFAARTALRDISRSSERHPLFA